jgi:hypothetical protein
VAAPRDLARWSLAQMPGWFAAFVSVRARDSASVGSNGVTMASSVYQILPPLIVMSVASAKRTPAIRLAQVGGGGNT